MFGFAGVTLQAILGYLFAPLAWLIGVPSHEILAAGSYIGQKVVMNEFVAFIDFVQHKATLSEHTRDHHIRFMWFREHRFDCDSARFYR